MALPARSCAVRLAGSLTLAVLLACPASAAELPFFDPFETSVFGYVSTVSNVSVTWSALDVDGAPDSGSALLVNTRSDATSGPVHYALACFAVEAGVPYTAGASILIPAGQTRTGVAQVFSSWFSSASCGGATLLSFGRTPEIRNAGSWLRSEQELVAPVGATGARIGIVLFKNETGDSLEAHFDDLLFAPEPADGVQGVAAMLALGSLGGWGRRRRGAGDAMATPCDARQSDPTRRTARRRGRIASCLTLGTRTRSDAPERSSGSGAPARCSA
jgi:hypothetical protein